MSLCVKYLYYIAILRGIIAATGNGACATYLLEVSLGLYMFFLNSRGLIQVNFSFCFFTVL